MDLPVFPSVNPVLGKVKNGMKGTYNQASEKHLPRYLAEFCCRFNRLFGLVAMLPRFG